MTVQFHDRKDAGAFLAERLKAYENDRDVVVLALPRGGVPVAHEVAKALHAPMDVFIVRKLGVPIHEELAMGAIASGGVRVLNQEIVDRLGISERMIEAAVAEQKAELERREREYRGDRPLIDIHDRTVILVDDGLATGATMRAAVRAIREHQPKKIVVAVPVGSRETCEEFEREADEVVCARAPEELGAVGMWYADFSQTTDEEVCKILEEESQKHGIARLVSPR